MFPYILIVIGAALSYAVSRQVYDAYEGEITGTGLLGYLGFEMVLVSVVLLGGNSSVGMGLTRESMARLLFLATAWTPTIVIQTLLITDYFGRLPTTAMFFPHVDKPVRNRLGRMRALLWDEDVSGAVKACFQEFDQHPEDYDVLLDGAALLADRGLYHEALRLLQEVISAFPDDLTAWSQATWRAAVIRMERLDDQDRARALFQQLAERAPDTEAGMCARERLYGRACSMQPVDADPFYRPKALRPKTTPGKRDETRSPERMLEDEMPGAFWDDAPRP